MQRNQSWVPRSALRAIAAWLMAAALAACATGPAPPTAATTPQGAIGTPEGCQADRSSDDALIGKTESEAVALLKGCTWRIGERDGQRFPATMDYRPERRTLGISSGKVTSVRRG